MKATDPLYSEAEMKNDIIDFVNNAVEEYKNAFNKTGQIIVVIGNGLANHIDEINKIDGVTAKISNFNCHRGKGPKHKEPFWTKRGRRS